MKYFNKNSFLGLLCATVFMCTPFLAKAQSKTFKSFKVGASVYPFGLSAGLGASSTRLSAYLGMTMLYLEPQYAITDNIGVGLRIEPIYGVGGTLVNDENDPPEGRGGVGMYLPITLHGDYYFTTTELRPSVGVGFGYYIQSTIPVGVRASDTHSSKAKENRQRERDGFGITPRFRLHVGHFVAGLSYHYTFNKYANNYINLNLGWEFGGGRR